MVSGKYCGKERLSGWWQIRGDEATLGSATRSLFKEGDLKLKFSFLTISCLNVEKAYDKSERIYSRIDRGRV